MTDPKDNVMREVWEWKRKAEEATQGMRPEEVIEFYKREADEVERKLGVRLRKATPKQALTPPEE